MPSEPGPTGLTRRLPFVIRSVAFGLLVGALVGSSSFAAAPPSIRVVPNPVQQGQTVTVFGDGFCAEATCGDVVISVDDEIVARVGVADDGSFREEMAAPSIPNQYRITADQADAGLVATVGLLVVPADLASTTVVGTTTVIDTTDPPDGTGDTTTTADDTADGTADSTVDGNGADTSVAAPDGSTSTTSAPRSTPDDSGPDGDGGISWQIATIAAIAAIALGLSIVAVRRSRP